MAEVTVWRADTPQGETFSDEFAKIKDLKMVHRSLQII